MPRPLRIHAPHGFYHVTLRGNHRQPIFTQDSERKLLNIIVARAMEKFAARLHAFCWMTNHLHLIVQVGNQPLGRVMQQIASQYARAYQSSLETTGHLFENRYHATLVDTDAYLLEAVRYVHQNPVRAGIVRSVARYRWSSDAAYRRPGEDPMVTTEFALAMFSPDAARAVVRYKAFVDEVPAAEMAAELEALEQGLALFGGSDFISRHTPVAAVSPSLEGIIATACRLFGLTPAELRSPGRMARLVAARAWVTRTALERGELMAAIARALHRDEASLRAALRRRPGGDVLAVVQSQVRQDS